MRKRSALAVWLLGLALTAMAAPVSKGEARQKAQQFMAQRGQGMATEAYEARRRAPKKDGDAPLYVFNGTEGFVVVSGDDRTEPILGYADSGTFDADNLPDNLRAWLQGYADAIEALDGGQDNTRSPLPAPRSPKNASPAGGQGMPRLAQMPVRKDGEQARQAIAPLLSTLWDQGNTSNPTYNQFCPTQDGLYCYTGCVATATAQIMYYHRWPQSPTPEVKGLAPVSFDWDGMKPVYGPADAKADYEAVARLMQYVGYGVDMNYGTGGSGAQSGAVPLALTQYFGYDGSVRYVERNRFDIESWDRLIYGELAEGRPVYYSGTSTGGGHAFVCDGYDGTGCYHINWGWGGMCNGFFRLSIMNPDGSGIGGSTTADGYTWGQAAVVGIRPGDGSGYEANLVLTTDEMTFSGTTIYINAFNLSGVTSEFYAGMGYYDEDGTLNWIYGYSIPDLPSGYGYNSLDYDVTDFNLPDGVYKIYPVSCVASDDAELLPSGSMSLYVVLTVSGGNCTLSYPGYGLAVEQMEPLGNRIAGSAQEVAVNINGGSEEYNGKLYLFASKSSYKGEAAGETGAAIPAGGQETVKLYFTPSSAGAYNLWVATDADGENVIGTGQVTIINAPTGSVTLEMTDCEIIPYPNATVTLTVKNTGQTAYYREVYALLYSEDDMSNYLTYQQTGTLSLQPGQEQQFSFPFENLEVGKEYLVALCYYQTYTAEQVSYFGYSDWFTIENPTVPEPPLTVTALSYEREYGMENPAFEYTVEGDGQLNGTPAISCEATKASPVGTYDIIVAQGDVSNGNVTYLPGTLTITPAMLTATADDQERMEGEENPELTISYDGFRLDDGEEVLVEKPVAATSATRKSEMGQYDIEVSGGEARNYVFQYVPGTLTIGVNTLVQDTARAIVEYRMAEADTLMMQVEAAVARIDSIETVMLNLHPEADRLAARCEPVTTMLDEVTDEEWNTRLSTKLEEIRGSVAELVGALDNTPTLVSDVRQTLQAVADSIMADRQFFDSLLTLTNEPQSIAEYHNIINQAERRGDIDRSYDLFKASQGIDNLESMAHTRQYAIDRIDAQIDELIWEIERINELILLRDKLNKQDAYIQEMMAKQPDLWVIQEDICDIQLNNAMRIDEFNLEIDNILANLEADVHNEEMRQDYADKLSLLKQELYELFMMNDEKQSRITSLADLLSDVSIRLEEQAIKVEELLAQVTKANIDDDLTAIVHECSDLQYNTDMVERDIKEIQAEENYCIVELNHIKAELDNFQIRLEGFRESISGIATGIEGILQDLGGQADVYSLSGRLVRHQTTTLQGLKPGVYVVGGRKIVIK